MGESVYLFILGELSPTFRHALEQRQESLGKELGREVSFEVVDQDRIAELYATFLEPSAQILLSTSA